MIHNTSCPDCATPAINAVEAQQLSQIRAGKADAMQRRHAVITIRKRQDAEAFIAGIRAQGCSFMDAIEALLVGSGKRFDGARASVARQRRGIIQSWLGPMLNELQEAADGDALKLLRDTTSFHDAVVRALYSPSSTTNEDARAVAGIFARYVEQARLQLNAAGANIGTLQGWAPQAHDAWKLLKGGVQGKEGWITFTAERLNVERSFPDAVGDAPCLRQLLSKVYDSIVMGHDGYVSAAEQGQAASPCNLASGMGEHRVLHFNDADAALAYNERYGQGNSIDAMVRLLDMASRKLALMESLGPNPQAMVESLMAAEQRRLSEAAGMAPDIREKQMGEIDRAKGIRGGKLGHWLAELSGETHWAAHPTLARAVSLSGATQSLSKLGEASLSAVADVFIKASAMRVNGLSWPESLNRSLLQYTDTYSEQNTNVARQIAVFIDFIVSDIHACWDAGNDLQDSLGELQQKLFKWSGLNWMTERGKAGYVMWLSQHLGEVAGKGFDKLDGPRRAMLQSHGIDAAHWDVMRQMVETGEDGQTFFVPGRAMDLEDAALEGLLPERVQLKSLPSSADKLASWERQRQAELIRVRNSLQTDSMAMIADETGFAIIEPDEKTRAFMRQGTRFGSVAGEFWRTIVQCKNLPIAYVQKAVGGRRWVRGDMQEAMHYPGNEGSGGDAFARNMGGLVGYTLSALTFGYAAMTLKNIAKGRKPRNPRKMETWLAAAVQSGGAGIYGGFFLGKVDRLGTDLAGTLTGPSVSAIGQSLTSAGMLARGEEGSAGEQGSSTAQDKAPLINLWYTRAALDWTLLYHVREWMSPGVLERMERKMKKELGQDMLLSPA